MKAIPVKNGNTYTINITSLGSNGEGVGRIDNFTVFVPYALKNENITITITTVKKTYAVGKIKHIITASPQRVTPRCGLYYQCGGCQLQHIAYPEQLKIKRQQVIDAIEHIGKQKNILIQPTLGAHEPWNYRNKMQFPIGKENKKVIIGCFAQGSHNIIDTENCYIQNKLNNDIANATRDIVQKLGISVYDEDRHTGTLRHIVGRVGKNGDCMIVLVTATKELRRSREIITLLRKKLPKLVSVHQNVQTYRNNVIMGRETNLLWGKQTIKDSLGPLSFHISPRSFFQVNTIQAENLYKKALEFAALTGSETVIDAYCGTGTITLFLAQKARKVYGIEIVKPAIYDARKNARDNHIKNAEFVIGDATAVMPRLYRQGIHPDVVVVDPPRAGCTPIVLKTFASMNPQRIVYVSCNPASLARDIALLAELGYKTKQIQPVDMFPQTSHVECVALMSRVQK
ncbi:23S rRNA (uracil(1939)-C(5))-methyltransferase RlmD [Pectinatus sottacetonis]|uniref:23S rRNA (uracil(1939)-C(5))-methyltransferase RlmD n=1 Tax=Pectinatus sottacetonis TaxID=1002795 RepID=UPI0018C6C22E|nr:23S rRNA (uracil(1939)-C(5))-methyltransferase RlmD [Pectinatus sottacetonis]